MDVKGAGGAPENRGASSSQAEGKAAVLKRVIVWRITVHSGAHFKLLNLR